MYMEYFPSSRLGVMTRPLDRNPRNLIALGITGSAKSTLISKYLEKEYENGSKIVDVWDSKNDFEGGFRVFPPSEKQNKIMKSLLTDSRLYKGETYPTKIFHPLCKTISNKYRKLPSCFELFSIPLNSLTLEDINFLAENTKPTTSSRILHNILKDLNNRTTLVDLFSKISELSRKTEASMYFGHRIKQREGTMKNFALKIFIDFHDEYTISSESNCLALTKEKLMKDLNDNKTFSVFSTKWVGDTKSKYFITLWIMHQIAQMKTDGLIEPKVVFVIRDLHTLAPRFYNIDEKFKTAMIGMIYDILSTYRSKDIEVVADNQDPTTLNTRLMGQFTEVLVGPISTPNEVQYLLESGASIDRNIIQAINAIKSSPLKQFYDLNSGEFITPLFPKHRHKEAGENFMKLWEEFYSGKFKEWTKMIADSKLEMSLAERKVKKEQKEIEEIEEAGEKEVKVELSLPEKVRVLGEFTRVDIERVLETNDVTAGRWIREWKKKGFIRMVGKSTSKNVKYVVM